MKVLNSCIIIFLVFVLFSSCEEYNPDPTPDPTPDPAPVLFSLAEFQGIETNGGCDWEYFSIEDNHFLAVANYHNGSTQNINSKIYKWNGYTYTLYQKISTNGARDWKYFSIEGDHFIVVANYHNHSTYNINSRIYKWDPATELFVSYQNIPTNCAYDWEYFSIEDDHFLVVANYYNGSTRNITSRIYKWNGVNFEVYQNIATNGAYNWEYFSIEGEHFLAVANLNNNTTHNIDSRIYKWNIETEQFDSYQDIATNGARDWKYFSIGGDHFLAVANNNSGSSRNINSRIYIWDTDEEEFDLHQPIATNGANDWEYFSIEDNHFLAVANYYNGETYTVDSRIYKWDPGQEQFGAYLSVETIGASDWKYFSIGDDVFLAVANSYNDSTYNINSMIYKVLY